MEMEHIIARKRMQTTQERRKGLILYLNLFSNYLLILILWRVMVQWHGNGTYHRKKKDGNSTRTS